ncbi:MAG: DUF5304 family protein [Actinomycetota bacterium]|nr:DUF5304 family protein [Actinomycetota bacterium]
MESANERAARYSDLFASGHDHPPECSYCPICATIAVVRNTNPEVLEHLAAAAREMIAAAGKLLDEAERVVGSTDGARRATEPEEPGKVRRIDVV